MTEEVKNKITKYKRQKTKDMKEDQGQKTNVKTQYTIEYNY